VIRIQQLLTGSGTVAGPGRIVAGHWRTVVEPERIVVGFQFVGLGRIVAGRYHIVVEPGRTVVEHWCIVGSGHFVGSWRLGSERWRIVVERSGIVVGRFGLVVERFGIAWSWGCWRSSAVGWLRC
jgi:hypothetical protein